MLVELSTEHQHHHTYVIHVLKDWSGDENDENKILIAHAFVITVCFIKTAVFHDDNQLEKSKQDDLCCTPLHFA